MINTNVDLKREIKAWGFPPIWNNLKYKYEFNHDYGSHTRQSFQIYDSDGHEKLDFCFAICFSDNGSIYIELVQLTVTPRDRRQGIGKFYLIRLKELCIKNSIYEIRLTLCTTAEDISYENAYTDKKELEKYYREILEDNSIKLITRH